MVDSLADTSIAPVDGPEAKGGPRYQKGFVDIVNKHFLSKLSEQKPEEKKVIVLFSHSDGINPFMRQFAPKSPAISSPCYCATIAVELSATDASSYSVESVNVI